MRSFPERTMDEEILFHRRKRSIRWPGIAGARLRPGTVGRRDRTGMGDALVMDLRKGFFAVSDSSNRNPAASRDFLLKFSGALDRFRSLDSGEIFTLEDFRNIRARVIRKSEEVLKAIPYTASCTFTGVLLVKTPAGTRGILWHMGDSLLVQVNVKTAEVKQLTTNNFWMAGRSKRFFQVNELEIPPEAILIIATDGISDLNRAGGSSRDELLIQQAVCHPVEEIPDRLADAIDMHGMETDDIALISLCPARLRFFETRIVLGGTREEDEPLRPERCDPGFDEDKYVPLRTCASQEQAL